MNLLTGSKVLGLRIHPQNPKVLYAASMAGLYKITDDTTVSIQKIGNGLPDYPRTVVINHNNPSTMYVTVGSYGVYKSSDGGSSFYSSNNGLTFITRSTNRKNAAYLAMSPVNPNYLYVSAYSTTEKHPYYSHDGGATWNAPSTMNKGNLFSDIYRNPGNGQYGGSPIAPHPSDANTALVAAYAGIPQKTTDGGYSWTYSGSGYTAARTSTGGTAYAWDANDKNRLVIFTTDFSGIITRNGGYTFKNIYVPLQEPFWVSTNVGAINTTSNNKVIVTARGSWEDQEIIVSHDDAASWKIISGTNGSYRFIAFHPQNSNVVYAGQFRSTDRGVTWKKLARKVDAVFQGNGDIVYSVATNPVTVYKSTDRGETWTSPYTPNPGIQSFNDIVVDPKNQNRVYLASTTMGVYIWTGSSWILRNEDNGITPDSFGSVGVSRLAVDPNNSNVVYAGKLVTSMGRTNGVFRSTDSGLSWKNITYNLGPEFTAWSLAVNPYDSYVYVGSNEGTWILPPPGQ
jgi:photosystem II stability/assembly factor-like uncharacterized protein